MNGSRQASADQLGDRVHDRGLTWAARQALDPGNLIADIAAPAHGGLCRRPCQLVDSAQQDDACSWARSSSILAAMIRSQAACAKAPLEVCAWLRTAGIKPVSCPERGGDHFVEFTHDPVVPARKLVTITLVCSSLRGSCVGGPGKPQASGIFAGARWQLCPSLGSRLVTAGPP
jgi:hypothetical protein